MLNEYRQFTVRLNKKPVNYRTGQVSNGLDPEIWTDFHTASMTAAAMGQGYGVGFVLTDSDPFFLIDLDHCHDGHDITALAADIIRRFNGCYSEVSQSGTGIHIIGAYQVPIAPHKCKNSALGIELYHNARMISITGTQATGDPLTVADEPLGSLIREYFARIATVTGEPAEWTTGPVDSYRGTQDDDALIERALRSRTNFALLWSGNIACYNHDHSSADQALCNQLMYWTGGDCERTVRLFERSGLMRDKWVDREDYRRSTVLSALASCTTFYMAGATSPDGLEFPDLSPRGKPLQTFENIDTLIRHLGGSCRYNLLKKSTELEFPDVDRLASVDFLRSWAERVGMNHGSLWDMVGGLSLSSPYCPAQDFIESVEWDGRDRIPELVGTLNPENPGLASMLIKRWLIYSANTVIDPFNAISPGVLVLQGDQGIGKTSWCRRLTENDRNLFFEGAYLIPTVKDTYLNVLNYWIVELGELNRSIRYTDWIKAFITNQQDYFRLPYARTAEYNPRRTSFIGTVNEDNYLVDRTGNRRFLTVRCGSSINYNHRVDIKQVWAQIVNVISQGETSILTKLESDMLNDVNEDILLDDPIVELLKLHYDVNDPRKRTMTITEIMKELGISTQHIKPRKVSPLICKFLKVSRSRRFNARNVFDMPNFH